MNEVRQLVHFLLMSQDQVNQSQPSICDGLNNFEYLLAFETPIFVSQYLSSYFAILHNPIGVIHVMMRFFLFFIIDFTLLVKFASISFISLFLSFKLNSVV